MAYMPKKRRERCPVHQHVWPFKRCNLNRRHPGHHLRSWWCPSYFGRVRAEWPDVQWSNKNPGEQS